MRKLLLLTALLVSTPAGATIGGNMVVTSPLIGEGQTIPRSVVGNTDGCNGMNISPTLDWTGAPAGTKSYALTLFDPDAPGGGWLHWVVFNIPLNPTEIPADAGSNDRTKLPQGASTLANSYKTQGYSGPCPPEGQTHNYEFTVYAMPEAHTFYPVSTTGPDTIQWLAKHALEFSTLTVKYGR